MEFTASHKHIRVTPRKLGLLADEVRGKGISDALNYLRFSPRKATAKLIEKVIQSAIANADRKGTVDLDQLKVKSILVGKGPTLKRFRPRAKGSASRRLKYTSHLFVILAEG